MRPFLHRRHVGASLLCAMLLALLAAPLRAQEAELSLDHYWQLVAETQMAVEDALAAESGASTTLQELSARWQAVDHVRLPGGERLPVEHGQLVAELSATDPNLELVLGRLQAAETIRQHWPSPAYDDTTAQAAVASLNEILSDPAFQQQEEPPSLFDRIWERVLRFLANLIPDEVSQSSFLNYLFSGLGLLLLLGILLYVARTFLGSFSDAAEVADEDGLTVPMSSQAAMQEAETLSRGGDYRTAVRYLYLSTLLLLDERNLLRYDRTQTNREYLKRLADHPQLSDTLRSIVDVFDRVWYGHHALDAAAYAHYEAQVKKIQQRR